MAKILKKDRFEQPERPSDEKTFEKTFIEKDEVGTVYSGYPNPTLVLSEEDYQVFLEAIENPPQPSDKLVSLFLQFYRFMSDSACIILSLSESQFGRSRLEKLNFDCATDPNQPKSGELELNAYLKRYALRNDQVGIAKTFVALSNQDKQEILGYYSTSGSTIQAIKVPEPPTKLPQIRLM